LETTKIALEKFLSKNEKLNKQEDKEQFKQILSQIETDLKTSPDIKLASDTISVLENSKWGMNILNNSKTLKQEFKNIKLALQNNKIKLLKNELNINKSDCIKILNKINNVNISTLDSAHPLEVGNCKLMFNPLNNDIYIVPNPKNVISDQKDPNLLGKGEFKSVYKAININTGQSLAFTQIDIKNYQDSYQGGDIHSFEKEVECMKKLEGKNGLCHLIHSTEYTHKGNKTISIFTEIYNGGVLGDAELNLKQAYENMSSENKLRVMGDLLEGLKNIHSDKIAHNDLNFSNILIRKDDNGHFNAAIFDYGQATLAGSTFKSESEQDVYEIGRALHKLFFDKPAPNFNAEKTDYEKNFKNANKLTDKEAKKHALEEAKLNYKEAATKKFDDLLHDLSEPDLNIKKLIMKMIVPTITGLRPPSDTLLSEFQKIQNFQ
jgi:tRNA A-37 threonylcarbamoyl transferase component Bud32